MANASDIAAVGRILKVNGDNLVFQPAGTSYELVLSTARTDLPVSLRTRGIVRVRARKILTVPSGGNFITPIFGPPRIIQGRIRQLDGKTMIVQAGAPVLVELPAEDSAYDLTRGPLAAGTLVNVSALPGASFEPVEQGPSES